MAIGDIIGGLSAQHGNATSGIGLSFGKGGFSLSGNFNQRKQKAMNASRTDSSMKKLFDIELVGTTPTLVFPEDIDDDHYIRFDVVDRVKVKSMGSTSTNVKKSIILPVPTQLNPQYTARYNDQAMGLAGAFSSNQIGPGDVVNAVNLGEAMVRQKFDDFTNFFDQDKRASMNEETRKQIQNLGSAVFTVGAAATIGKLAGGNIGAILGAAVGGVGTAFQGAMSSAGFAINPHMAVLFDGVGFRSFTFNYRFIPRNPNEANELKEMIRVMQEAMYPSLPENNRFLFKYPDEFLISLAPKLQETTFKFKRSVLKDMNVNYNGDGVPRFYDDGNPVVVDISLTFQEVEILTKEDFAGEQLKKIDYVPDPPGSEEAEMEAYLADNPDYYNQGSN